MFLLYDDSFEGFLTAVHEAFYSKSEDISIMSQKRFGITMFKYRFYETDMEKAEKVKNAIHQKLSSGVFSNVYNAWLSHATGIEDWIVKYLKLCFQLKKDMSNAMQEQSVQVVMKAARMVGREVHRFMGFVRFKSLGENIYIADIEPDYDILPLCIDHFKSRFSAQRFILRDLTYKKALIYNLEEAIIVQMTDDELSLQLDDDIFENLWRAYFKTMAIKERINPRLQMQNMPKKYWKHLVEKQ